jgi:hypothetical protein
LSDERTRWAVEVAERLADGLADENERASAEASAKQALLGKSGPAWFAAMAGKVSVAKRVPVPGVARITPPQPRYGDPTRDNKPREQAHLLRDIVGPLLFRAVPLEHDWLAWNGGLIVKLAHAAYEERFLPRGRLDNARLAVLADALQDAGSENQEILSHLREPGALHVRGCWVVDALTGRE